MSQPLDGIQVLDLSRALAGPYCSMMLSDMGASIIKIEQPEIGDTARGWGPPFQGGESSYFLGVNRNKHSVALNLRDPRGIELLHKLIAKSDVLLENFVPGTMERYGCSYDACRAIKPDLIYCSISGFGQIGPDRERAAYDQIAQGLGGIMSFTGPLNGEPTRVGIALADISSGMFAAYAIVAALYHRLRTGEGQMIDTSLLDGQLAMLTYQASSYFATGKAPKSTGNQHPSIVPYGVYRASDAYFNLAVGTDDLWRRFCQAFGLHDVFNDSRFRTNRDRLTNRELVNGILEPLFADLLYADIEIRLREFGVPCGPVRDLEGVFSDPQVQALGSVKELEHPRAGTIKVVAAPYRLSATPTTIRSAPPLLGQHTDDTLLALGYTHDDIAALREAKVVA